MRDPYGQHADEEFKLVVERDADIVVFIKYSYQRQALGYNQMLVLLGAFVVLFTGLAWVVGLLASRRVMRPVADLATRLSSFRGEHKPAPLAPHFPDDEVGQLAAALDDYATCRTTR
jgi:hypothetical protein